MKPVFQVSLCISLLAAALPAAALAAGEFTPPAGLILWLKPDAGITKDGAGKITAWQDQSGAGHHATGVAATAPVLTTEGGLSFAHFDGTNFLDFGSAVSAKNFTVVAAIRFQQPTTPKFTFWFGGSGHGFYAGGGGNWSMGGITGPVVGWGAFKGTSEESWPWLVSKNADTDLGIISLTNQHLYRNGNDVTYYMQQYIPGFVHTRLGGRTDDFTQNFTGDVAEVLVFNQSLTTKEQGMVEAYLMGRYHVAMPDTSQGVGVGPTGRSGLILWLKPDAGITKDGANKITAWQDQSGAGHHATGEAATAPVFTTEGGRSFVRFDKSKTQFLNCAVSATNYTVVAAIQTPQPTFSGGSDGYDPHYFASTYWFGGSGHGLIAGGGSALGGNTTYPLGWGIIWRYVNPNKDCGFYQLRSTKPDAGLIIMSVTNEQLWRNGMSDVAYERGGGEAHCQGIPRDIGPLPPIALTKLGGSPDYFNYDPDFAGDIHEVLIYNKILSVQERGMVESYMLNRYNIAATVAGPGAGSVITPAARLRIERDAVGNLTVTPQFAGEYRLQVTSLDGKLLRSVIASGACQVARATLPSGLCLVRVEGGGQVAVRRIVIW